MINLDERILYYGRIDANSIEGDVESIKDLIREVIGEITPDRRNPTGLAAQAFNSAIDDMESKAKELGL